MLSLFSTVRHPLSSFDKLVNGLPILITLFQIFFHFHFLCYGFPIGRKHSSSRFSMRVAFSRRFTNKILYLIQFQFLILVKWPCVTSNKFSRGGFNFPAYSSLIAFTFFLKMGKLKAKLALRIIAIKCFVFQTERCCSVVLYILVHYSGKPFPFVDSIKKILKGFWWKF